MAALSQTWVRMLVCTGSARSTVSSRKLAQKSSVMDSKRRYVACLATCAWSIPLCARRWFADGFPRRFCSSLWFAWARRRRRILASARSLRTGLSMSACFKHQSVQLVVCHVGGHIGSALDEAPEGQTPPNWPDTVDGCCKVSGFPDSEPPCCCGTARSQSVAATLDLLDEPTMVRMLAAASGWDRAGGVGQPQLLPIAEAGLCNEAVEARPHCCRSLRLCLSQGCEVTGDSGC